MPITRRLVTFATVAAMVAAMSGWSAAPANAGFADRVDFLLEWGSPGAGNGQLNIPRGVAVDAAGRVYVADTANHRIQKFTANGTYLTQWGSTGSGDGQFEDPLGIDVAPSGIVYVVDRTNHRVQRFTPTGVFLSNWGGFGSGNGEFIGPSDAVPGSAPPTPPKPCMWSATSSPRGR